MILVGYEKNKKNVNLGRPDSITDLERKLVHTIDKVNRHSEEALRLDALDTNEKLNIYSAGASVDQLKAGFAELRENGVVLPGFARDFERARGFLFHKAKKQRFYLERLWLADIVREDWEGRYVPFVSELLCIMGGREETRLRGLKVLERLFSNEPGVLKQEQEDMHCLASMAAECCRNAERSPLLPLGDEGTIWGKAEIEKYLSCLERDYENVVDAMIPGVWPDEDTFEMGLDDASLTALIYSIDSDYNKTDEVLWRLATEDRTAVVAGLGRNELLWSCGTDRYFDRIKKVNGVDLALRFEDGVYKKRLAELITELAEPVDANRLEDLLLFGAKYLLLVSNFTENRACGSAWDYIESQKEEVEEILQKYQRYGSAIVGANALRSYQGCTSYYQLNHTYNWRLLLEDWREFLQHGAKTEKRIRGFYNRAIHCYQDTTAYAVNAKK